MLNKIVHGDCLEVLKTLEDSSIDSIVTDPPYELGFMGKKWDNTGIAYNVDLWKECLRVLKPGGHLLAFGGTRTYHRMTCAIEDAGFEIRDCIQWLYGSGFPKSHNISKAIDKRLGGTPKQGRFLYKNGKTAGGERIGQLAGGAKHYETIPDTEQARQWDGWGTALKPANEPIVLARKPISEKTIAENVMKWGTGGINIDGCRIESSKEDKKIMNKKASKNPTSNYSDKEDKIYGKYTLDKASPANPIGRFPTNVILDEEAGRMLDEQQEGVSRFFYCAKASKKERNIGLEDTPELMKNHHPTVKPIKLMEYLVKLITQPEGTVLDPFLGSGTTAIACMNTDRNFIGIEKEKKYFDIANERVASHTVQQRLELA